MKIRPVEELSHAESRTGQTWRTVALCNFVNAPKNYLTDNISGEYIRAHVRKTEVMKCWKMDLTNIDDGRQIKGKGA